MMNRLPYILIRLAFYPSLWFNRLMCALGFWNRWDAIDDHVLLGALPSCRDLERLADLDVGAVINMCLEFPGHHGKLSSLGLTQLHLPTLDFHPPGESDIKRGLDFLQQQIAEGKKVYIHCKAGRGRSATLVLCYLITTLKLTPEEAYRRIQSKRGQIDRGLQNRAVVQLFH